MKRLPTAAFTLVLAIGSYATVASADVLRVPGDYPTIQGAIDAASPGDEVEVAAGRYDESITLSAGVTVRGAGPGETEIVATGAHVVTVTNVQDTRVEGFTLRGASSVAVMVEGPGAVGGADIVDVVVLESGGGFQFYASGGSVQDSVIRDMPGDDVEGISCMNGSSPLVVNNTIANVGIGVMSYYDSNPEILNNTIVDSGIGIDFRAFFDMAVSEPRIVNNVLVGNGTGIRALNGAVAREIRTNLLWDNDTDYVDVPAEPSNVGDDPLFVDRAGGDLHLAVDSPCIDTGSDVAGVPDHDQDGVARPFDGDDDGAAVIDIGAYEYTGDGPPPDSDVDTDGDVDTDADADSDTDTDTGDDDDGGDTEGSGCGCSTGAGASRPGEAAFVLFGILALAARRPRRHSVRARRWALRASRSLPSSR